MSCTRKPHLSTVSSTTLRAITKKIAELPKKFVIFLIVGYQWTIPPDHGVLVRWMFPYGYCRYHPTCSEYARRAVERYGAVRGLARAVWRVLRCNPWSKGGVDEVQ